jgi:hypothetical protein
MQSQKENLSLSYEYLEEKEKGKVIWKDKLMNWTTMTTSIHQNIKNKSTIPLIKRKLIKKT